GGSRCAGPGAQDSALKTGEPLLGQNGTRKHCEESIINRSQTMDARAPTSRRSWQRRVGDAGGGSELVDGGCRGKPCAHHLAGLWLSDFLPIQALERFELFERPVVLEGMRPKRPV